MKLSFVRNASGLHRSNELRVRATKVASPLALIVLLVLYFSLLCAPALAQSETDRSAVCMRGAFAAEAVAQSPQGSGHFDIVVAERDVAALRKFGFQIVDCAEGKLSTVGQKLRWRNRICRVAGIRSQQVQLDVTKKLNISANILCGTAELALGQWGRTK